MARIPAVVNIAAGTATNALEMLRADDRFHVHECTPETVARFVSQEAGRGAERIVVAGGDGTLAAAAAVLTGTSTALAIVPAGTLNHFALELGIPTDLNAALNLAVSGSVRQVDAGFLNDRLFLNTSSVGAYVIFARTRERLERWFGYYGASIIAAAQTWARLQNLVIEFETDGQVKRFHSPLVFVSVGERELRPPGFGTRKSDGRRELHILIVRPTTRIGLLALAFRALLTRVRIWGSEKDVESVFTQKCCITLHASRIWAAMDGEILRVQTPLEYASRVNALKVIT